MPSFTIEGNPGSVRSKASGMRSHAQTFTETGDALATITTDGWVGRAGERFRDKFDAEPDRWRDAGAGWERAASALETYAGELERAKDRADWAKDEYARGEQVTRDARAAYDADVSAGKREQSQAQARGEVFHLTIVPFDDPGEEVRQAALREYDDAKADLDTAAHECASGVKAGCVDAPEKRKWYEKVGGAIGGFFAGAGEALADLGKLAYFLTMPHVAIPMMLMQDLHSGLTPEEIAAKYKLKLEDAKAIGEYAISDPGGFGKTLGKAVLDWDTWADDPARAAGRLLPDAVIAVLTAGTGTAATRGAAATKNAVKGLDDVADITKFDDLKHVDLDEVPGFSRGGDLGPDTPRGDLYPDDYQRFGDLGEQGFFNRYWDEDAGSWRYPTKEYGYPDGFDGPTEPNTLEKDDLIDRFSHRDGGEYASPADTPFEQRALPPSSVGNDYYQYRVVKPLPADVLQGDIAPWFEQVGGGTQYKFPSDINDYIPEYLERVPRGE